MPIKTTKAAAAADSPDVTGDDESERADVDVADENDGGSDVVADDAVDDDGFDRDIVSGSPASRLGTRGLAVVFVILAALGLTAVIGWLGYRNYQARQAVELRTEFLQAARQTAVNLTTIDWQHADTDVQRIMDGATGAFYDDFSQRAQPFLDVVKKAQSASVGTVTAAGVESSTANDAQVLVAVSVQTTNAVTPQQEQRSWRMRLAVQKVGDAIAVSHVEFVA